MNNYGISEQEAVRQIEEVYHAKADLTNKDFDVFEQLLVCESIAESMPDEPTQRNSPIQDKIERTNEDVVIGDGNGGYKFDVNFELNQSKFEVIEQLKKCNSKTSPYLVESLLKRLFPNSKTISGHWLYVAQTYPPRPINRVINEMVKEQKSGFITIRDAAAYFTNSIKFRAKRKIPKKRKDKHE